MTSHSQFSQKLYTYYKMKCLPHKPQIYKFVVSGTRFKYQLAYQHTSFLSKFLSLCFGFHIWKMRMMSLVPTSQGSDGCHENQLRKHQRIEGYNQKEGILDKDFPCSNTRKLHHLGGQPATRKFRVIIGRCLIFL